MQENDADRQTHGFQLISNAIFVARTVAKLLHTIESMTIGITLLKLIPNIDFFVKSVHITLFQIVLFKNIKIRSYIKMRPCLVKIHAINQHMTVLFVV